MPGELPHICFLAPNAFPLLSGDSNLEFIGGAELQQVAIARQLAARGYSVSMICLDFGQEDVLTVDGITVLRAFHLKAGIPVLRFLWPRLTSVWKCMNRANADIYYQRAASHWTGVMVAFCRSHRKKSVFAAAGNPDLAKTTPRIRYARDRWIYSYGLRYVDRILVQNPEQARLCQLNYGRDGILMPNLYLVPKDRPAMGQRHMIWVSTIRKIKRPEMFLDLAEALPNLSFLMIGGPGRNESDLFESIRLRAEKIRNVQFLGFMPYVQVDGKFDEAMLLVNTSESEGFPNTFLQAWARGIPTVSFVDAGARLDGRPVGIQSDSLETMKVAIAILATNQAARVEEGNRCRAYFENNHSASHILSRYEQLFAGLLKSGPS